MCVATHKQGTLLFTFYKATPSIFLLFVSHLDSVNSGYSNLSLQVDLRAYRKANIIIMIIIVIHTSRQNTGNVSYIELRIWNQVSHDHRSFERNLSNCEQKPEKVRTSTGFEPVTSRYLKRFIVCNNIVCTLVSEHHLFLTHRLLSCSNHVERTWGHQWTWILCINNVFGLSSLYKLASNHSVGLKSANWWDSHFFES